MARKGDIPEIAGHSPVVHSFTERRQYRTAHMGPLTAGEKAAESVAACLLKE